MSFVHAGLDAALRGQAEPEAGTDGGHDARGLRDTLSGDGWRDLRAGGARVGRSLPAPGIADGRARPVSLRRIDPSGRGRADGGLVRPAGGAGADGRPRFDAYVGPGGYAWWYVDALSDDGRFGLTVIAFVGSVFSPWYAWSGRERPENHVALNVALYGGGVDRWCMTERSRGALRRDRSSLTIGASSVAWDRHALTIRFDELTAPVPPWPTIPKRMRGVVRVRPTGLNAETFRLDAAGRHLWTPIAPRARVEVETEEPGVRWTGTGYFDCNAGSEPLEDAFSDWNWSRAHLGRDTAIAYDLRRRDGTDLSLALRFAPEGAVERVPPPPAARLPSTVWRVPRTARAEAARLDRTWEDTPFYSRSTVRGRMLGEDATAVHESLSLDRLRAPWVRALLPFRMPRALR